MSRRTVVFLATEFPTPESPVVGTFVREHAQAAALTADVVVVHLQRAAARRGLVEVVDEQAGDLRVLRVPYRRLGPPLSYLAFAAGAVMALRALAREGIRPDVLHANSFLSALAGLLLRRLSGAPLAYTEHWSVFLPEDPARLSPPMRVAARTALERADAVLPVSGAMERALRGLAARARLVVVPNAVDPALFHPPAAGREGAGRRTAAGGPVRLLYVGLLYDAKGLDVLLPALAALRAEGQALTLDVVGDGVLRDATESLAAGVGLGDVVAFHGIRPKPEVAERMRDADLLVLSSRFENNPCVLLEALCCGLPVVATTVGGVPEIVGPAAGELAAPGDPAAFADALRRAIARLPGFDRAAIAAAAASRYHAPSVGAALHAVYDEIARRS